ncbi:hypothetical protein A2U01_0103748, partial [Trifolium medium]|nr:hypothetical protein [Trifolium medium]
MVMEVVGRSKAMVSATNAVHVVIFLMTFRIRMTSALTVESYGTRLKFVELRGCFVLIVE